MVKNLMKFKTIVPKQGDIHSYVHKPVINKIEGDPFSMKSIGVISEAIEVSEGYELTIDIKGEYAIDVHNEELSSISIDIK